MKRNKSESDNSAPLQSEYVSCKKSRLNPTVPQKAIQDMCAPVASHHAIDERFTGWKDLQYPSSVCIVDAGENNPLDDTPYRLWGGVRLNRDGEEVSEGTPSSPELLPTLDSDDSDTRDSEPEE